MGFIFFDTETTSKNHLSGQIVEFSSMPCDTNLNIVGEAFCTHARLRPHIIPELGALMVTNKTIEQINSSTNSHYQMISDIFNYAKEWTPSTWLGWNSIEFDFKWLRQAYHESMKPSYIHQITGNNKGDALPIARAAHMLRPNTLKTTKNKRGKHSFKLEELAKANSINHDKAHTAASDVLATIRISQIIHKKNVEVWEEAQKTLGKENTEQQLWGNPLFVAIESFYGHTKGLVMTAICHHPRYQWTMGLDLKLDPRIYINLNGEELRKILRTSPKILRTVQSSNHPIILNESYVNQLPEYKNLGLDTLKSRASFLNSQKRLKQSITSILLSEVDALIPRAMSGLNIDYLNAIFPPPTILSQNDKSVAEEFDRQSCWNTKYEISKGFKCPISKKMALRVIWEEATKTLPDQECKEIWEETRGALNNKDECTWNTIHKSKEEINKVRLEKKSYSDAIVSSLEGYINKLKKVYKID